MMQNAMRGWCTMHEMRRDACTGIGAALHPSDLAQ